MVKSYDAAAASLQVGALNKNKFKSTVRIDTFRFSPLVELNKPCLCLN